jgi:hypothetical protein
MHLKKTHILNMNRLLFVFILTTLISSCAQVYWEKYGVSQQEYTKDRYECERDRRQSYFDESEDMFARNRFEELCMQSKGYNKVIR